MHCVIWVHTLTEYFISYLFFRLNKSSAAVAFPLRCLTHCVFIPLLQCLVICITVTFLSAMTCLALLLWPLSLAMLFCLQNCCSLDVFCFSHHSLQTLETAMCDNPRRSAASNHLVWHQQSFRSQSHLDHISSPFLRTNLVWITAEPLYHIYIVVCILFLNATVKHEIV